MNSTKWVLIPCLLIACVAGYAAELLTISEGIDAGGMTSVVVENRHASPVTALLIQAKLTSEGKPKAIVSSYLDVYVNAFHDKPLVPGERRTIPVLSSELARKWSTSIALSGVIFADGARYGTKSGIDTLIGRRQAIQDSIVRFRASLRALRGSEIGSVIAGIDVATREQKEEAEQFAPKEQLPVLAAGSQVAQWVRGAFDGAPAACRADCVSKRIDYVMNGLLKWEEQIRIGLVEASPR